MKLFDDKNVIRVRIHHDGQINAYMYWTGHQFSYNPANARTYAKKNAMRAFYAISRFAANNPRDGVYVRRMSLPSEKINGLLEVCVVLLNDNTSYVYIPRECHPHTFLTSNLSPSYRKGDMSDMSDESRARAIELGSRERA